MTNSRLFNQRGFHYLYPPLGIGLGVLLRHHGRFELRLVSGFTIKSRS